MAMFLPSRLRIVSERGGRMRIALVRDFYYFHQGSVTEHVWDLDLPMVATFPPLLEICFSRRPGEATLVAMALRGAGAGAGRAIRAALPLAQLLGNAARGRPGGSRLRRGAQPAVPRAQGGRLATAAPAALADPLPH